MGGPREGERRSILDVPDHDGAGFPESFDDEFGSGVFDANFFGRAVDGLIFPLDFFD